MKKTKISIQYIISICVLIICIMLTLALAYVRNRNRNLDQVDRYIDELSVTTTAHVEDVFDDKLSSIDSIAYLYGNAIKSTEVDLDLLSGLEEKSGFDWIRFIASDGTDYASDGSTTHVEDREYFKQGIEGKSGMCEVIESRINGEKLIGFYAPVYFQNTVYGVMVGFLTENTVSMILKTELYGYPADTLIFREDGIVLGRYMADGTSNISDLNDVIEYVSQSSRENVVEAIEKNENYRFTFKDSLGVSVGYVVPIKGTNWSVVQMFPSGASHIVIQGAFQDGSKTFSMITMIFVIFIVFIIYTYRKTEKLKAEELAYQKVNSVMRCVTEDYMYLIDVDLDTQQEITYRLSSGDCLKDWTHGNQDYTYCITQYANTYVAEYDRDRFMKATELSTLRDVLSRQTDFYIEYDGIINGNIRQFQEKYTMPNDRQFDHHMLISIRDITESIKERNAKEKELAEAKRMAESANNAKTAFLFNMSHDIRTPMNAIVGFTNLLEMHLDDEEKAKNYIKKIKASSEFLLSLINNVLEMARIESGKMILEESAWNIEQLSEMLLSVFEEQFKNKKLHFTEKINIIHKDIICDSLKLKEIYLNILSNAVKYTPEGGSISICLDEFPSEKEGISLYQCVVSDTGIGMSEEFCAHIFEEFTREMSSTESKIVGSGLGMAIVKRLVEFMNGTIHVKSRIGKGTTVTIKIPHKIAVTTETSPVPSRTYENAESVFRQKRILLVEDNDLNAEIAEEILKSTGIITERAKDGLDCVHMVQEAGEDYYDLILMDIQMPHMNGYDAARAIRKMHGKQSQIPIIAMTANAFEEDKKNAFDAGMNGHIAKPIEITKMIKTLQKYFS